MQTNAKAKTQTQKAQVVVCFVFARWKHCLQSFVCWTGRSLIVQQTFHSSMDRQLQLFAALVELHGHGFVHAMPANAENVQHSPNQTQNSLHGGNTSTKPCGLKTTTTTKTFVLQQCMLAIFFREPTQAETALFAQNAMRGLFCCIKPSNRQEDRQMFGNPFLFLSMPAYENGTSVCSCRVKMCGRHKRYEFDQRQMNEHFE